MMHRKNSNASEAKKDSLFKSHIPKASIDLGNF